MVVLLAIPANWLYLNIHQVNNQATWQQQNYFDTNDYFLNLNRISYSIYADLLRQGHDSIEEANAELIQINNTVGEEISWDEFDSEKNEEFSTYRYLNEQLEAQLSWFQNIRQGDFLNLQYAAIHHELGNSISRGDASLRQLAEGTVSFGGFDTWRYQQLMILTFDESGNLTVNSTLSTTDSLFRGNPIWDFEDSLMHWKPIRNTTIVFAVPEWLEHADVISQFQEENHRMQFKEIMRENILVMTLTVGISALVIPLKIIKPYPWFKKIEQLPVEIIGFTLLITLVLLFGIMPHFAYTLFINQIWSRPFLTRFYIYLFSIGSWMALFATLILGIQYFKVAIKNPKIHLNLDLKNPFNKNLIIFISIQFIFMSLMSLAGRFGIVMAFIYSVSSFWFLRKYLTKTQKNYLRILEITNNITGPNQVSIDEELGLFNSIKDTLKKVGKLETKETLFKDEMIQNLSKELEKSVSEILASIEVLKDETVIGNKQDLINELDHQSNHLKQRIHDLVQINELTLNPDDFVLKSVNVVNLIQESLTVVEEQMEKTTVMLRTQFPDFPVIVETNEEILEHVVVNLLMNMVKHSLPKTRAYVDVIAEEESVSIQFRNISLHEIEVNEASFIKLKEASMTGLTRLIYEVEQLGGLLTVELDGDLVKVNINMTKY